MSKTTKALLWASFAADALALGAHWIYNTAVIDQRFGRPERFETPHADSFHKNRKQGAFTHYGDQTMLLLRSVAENRKFELEHFGKVWLSAMWDYDGYIDNATRITLRNFESGWPPEDTGSPSTDLAGAARIAPLVYFLKDDPEALIQAARAQTAMTHNQSFVVESAAFFASLMLDVIGGASIAEVLQKLQANGFNRPPFNKWTTIGIESAESNTREAILKFGQMCEIDSAFPSTIHLIVKYEDNLREGLIQNVMAGGDSAARGMIAGMVLGARQGMDSIPDEWIADLKAREEIETLLELL